MEEKRKYGILSNVFLNGRSLSNRPQCKIDWFEWSVRFLYSGILLIHKTRELVEHIHTRRRLLPCSQLVGIKFEKKKYFPNRKILMVRMHEKLKRTRVRNNDDSRKLVHEILFLKFHSLQLSIRIFWHRVHARVCCSEIIAAIHIFYLCLTVYSFGWLHNQTNITVFFKCQRKTRHLQVANR